MEAVTTQLAASGEFTLGAKVVFACNFSLAACGILLLLRRSKSRPSRSPFLVGLLETSFYQPLLLILCLLFGFFGPFALGFLPMLIAVICLWALEQEKYNKLFDFGDTSWSQLIVDASVRLMKLWPGIFLLSFVAATLFRDHPEQESIQRLSQPQSLNEILGIAIYAIVVAPLLEEFLFRGILYRFMKRPFGMGPSIVISSTLFALVHKNTLSFFPLLFLGVFLAVSYERTGDLRTSIFMHGFFNLIMVFFVLLRHGF